MAVAPAAGFLACFCLHNSSRFSCLCRWYFFRLFHVLFGAYGSILGSVELCLHPAGCPYFPRRSVAVSYGPCALVYSEVRKSCVHNIHRRGAWVGDLWENMRTFANLPPVERGRDGGTGHVSENDPCCSMQPLSLAKCFLNCQPAGQVLGKDEFLYKSFTLVNQ